MDPVPLDPVTLEAFGKAGAVAAITLAAVGSALGTGTAGMASIGAWKRCFLQNKAAPFLLLIFIGAPLSQTIYGMILMYNLADRAGDAPLAWPVLLIGGALAGIAMGVSAWFQGRAGAAGADALAETGQGFGNYLMTIGVVETVALFVLVFVMIGV